MGVSVVALLFVSGAAMPLGAQQLIDIKANLVYPHKVNDSLSVLCLVGDFAAQHNGAVITADSAVRYNDDRLECFGNVLINKNTTYVYADRADYDGERNIAALFAPLVKVVDQDMTMYTYNFEFNTLDNVGRYWGGGLMRRVASEKGGKKGGRKSDQESGLKDDLMVANRGYFFADNEEIVGVDGVEASGEGYLLKGDSIIYNTANEQIRFYDQTNIWSNQEDYIYGDLGRYDKLEERYDIEKNGYMLRPEQEMWSDTMRYFSARNIAILYQNIQLDDTKNKSIAYGDYGQYWGDDERILLTRNPTLVNYNEEATKSDPFYLRGDTIMLLSYALGTGPMVGDGDSFDTSMFDELDSYATKGDDEALEEGEESSDMEGDGATEGAEEDLEEGAIDSLSQNDSVVKLPTRSELRAAARELRHAKRDSQEQLRIEKQRQADLAEAQKQQAKDDKRDAAAAAKLRVERIKEYRKLMAREERLESKIAERMRVARSIYTDSMFLLSVVTRKGELARHIERDSLVAWEGIERWPEGSGDSIYRDAMGREFVISRDVEVLEADSLSADAVAQKEPDSLYRVIVAYHNVRAFNKEFQMVSDSMVMESVDSTVRLFVKPVVWSAQHQMTAEQMDLYMNNGELDYADLVEKPIMASQVRDNDSIFFNQIVGKEMRITFENNDVKRNDVFGNVETLYFMVDDVYKDDVTTVAKIESGAASFYVEEKQLQGATYRTEPTYIFAPVDKRPSEVVLYLDNFAWYRSRRPELVDVFDRVTRASLRDSVAMIEKPTFAIADSIDAERASLIKARMWRDRTDKVSRSSTEWMKSLGYTPGEPRPEGSSRF